jgi:acetate kinase
MIVTLNAGSSSLKLALFETWPAIAPILTGALSGIGEHPRFTAHDAKGNHLIDRDWPNDANAPHEKFLTEILDCITSHTGGKNLQAAGHRIVHGGAAHSGPARITPELLSELKKLVPLAPLHQPHNLAAIRALAKLRPSLPQVACFDTAFHHTLPTLATQFAIPMEYSNQGVRRYGFHGLSYNFIAGRLKTLAPTLAAGRVIVAHLGAGASLCALRNGISIDTTMGFTALDGLMMATRCGTIDPGILLYLQQTHGLSAAHIEDILYHKSGLLGVSGVSGDIRTLHASNDPRAQIAVELFTYSIARAAGGLVSSLGGLDGFVFTAGIGENDAQVRAAVCGRLAWFGITLDLDSNQNPEGQISSASSRVAVWVIPTDEERMIAEQTQSIVKE